MKTLWTLYFVLWNQGDLSADTTEADASNKVHGVSHVCHTRCEKDTPQGGEQDRDHTAMSSKENGGN